MKFLGIVEYFGAVSLLKYSEDSNRAGKAGRVELKHSGCRINWEELPSNLALQGNTKRNEDNMIPMTQVIFD